MKTKSFKEYLEKRFSQEEIDKIEREAREDIKKIKERLEAAGDPELSQNERVDASK